MIQKMHRTAASSLFAFALVMMYMTVSPTAAQAMGPATFCVGLLKTMANMAQEPIQIIMLPFELADKDDTSSVSTDIKPSSSTTTTTTTTTSTKTTP